MLLKVQESLFIQEKKPLLYKLREALLREFDYASILAVDSSARRCAVSRRNMSAGEDEMLSSRGFVARVSGQGRYAEYSFNRLSESALPEIVESVKALAAASLLPEGLQEHSYPSVPEEKLTFSGSTEYEIDPEALGDEAILNHLCSLRDKGLAMSGELLDFQAMFNYQRYTKLFLSREKELLQNVMWATGGIVTVAARGEEVKNSFRGFSLLGGAELLEEMEAGVEACVNTTLDLLRSEPIPPGEYDCICAPDVTGMIVHEAFGHGVEMDMFVKKRALAESYIGLYVASPLVTMHDGGARQTASYFFDDEGVMAQDTVVIDKGILRRGISDLQSALTLGTPPSGNGRRQDYCRKAYTRMTNTWFEGGSDRVEDMIASIENGFLLENASSGMEDPKNWGIQCMVNVAREIKDGRLTGRIFSPVVLTGYVPDLLKSISAMSQAPALSGTGFCGKGYKEWVNVSDGGPYIKARIRLG